MTDHTTLFIMPDQEQQEIKAAATSMTENDGSTPSSDGVRPSQTKQRSFLHCIDVLDANPPAGSGGGSGGGMTDSQVREQAASVMRDELDVGRGVRAFRLAF